MATSNAGQQRPFAHARNATVFSFSFDTNGTASPDGLSDPGGVVSAMTWSSTGVLIATLTHRYAKIHATASLDTAINHVLVGPIVEGGAAANTITITTTDDADVHAVGDTTNVKIFVTGVAYGNTT